MALVTITVDNASPLIQYSGSWITNHVDDPEATLCWAGTYGQSDVADDSWTLTTNATSMTACGSLRPTHGYYGWTIAGDGADTSEGVATSYSADIALQQQLATWSGSLSEVSLTMTNRNNINGTAPKNQVALDLDYILLQTEIGTEPDAAVNSMTIDDSDPALIYYGSSWTTSFSATPTYSQSTGHLSLVPHETVTISFMGESIAVYGAVNMNHGAYSATLDGELFPAMMGWYYDIIPKTMLFLASGLDGTEQHKLVMENLGGYPNGTSQSTLVDFDIDYIVINSTKTPKILDSNEVGTTSTSSASTTLLAQTSIASATLITSRVAVVSSRTVLPTTTISLTQSTLTTTSVTDSVSLSPSPTTAEQATDSTVGQSAFSHGLPTGAIVGIILGASLCCSFLVAVTWICCHRSKTRSQSDADSDYYHRSDTGSWGPTALAETYAEAASPAPATATWAAETRPYSWHSHRGLAMREPSPSVSARVHPEYSYDPHRFGPARYPPPSTHSELSDRSYPSTCGPVDTDVGETGQTERSRYSGQEYQDPYRPRRQIAGDGYAPGLALSSFNTQELSQLTTIDSLQAAASPPPLYENR